MREGERFRLEQRLRDIFRDAGVRGWAHAVPVHAETTGGADGKVGVDPDAPVVMASVYKVIVLAAWCRAVDAGSLDPGEPVTVPPERRTSGPTGLSGFADAVTLSWRDLVRSMITVSDNAAADVVLERLGPAAVDAIVADLGLTGTRVRGGTAEVHASLVADTGAPDVEAAFTALADHDTPARIQALDPAYGSATTARDMTTLLAALWRGEVAGPERTAFARHVLADQVWPHRLRAGFPPRAAVAGKTGTLGPLRNEVGVVTYPGEHPVAVAVFTHAARADRHAPRADAAIAAVAAAAVDPLRSGAVR